METKLKSKICGSLKVTSLSALAIFLLYCCYLFGLPCSDDDLANDLCLLVIKF